MLVLVVDSTITHICEHGHANTKGGGGGAGPGNTPTGQLSGGNGGSGIVVIAYPT